MPFIILEMMINEYKWYKYSFSNGDYHITIAKDDNHAMKKCKEFVFPCIKIEKIDYPNKIVYERENKNVD